MAYSSKGRYEQLEIFLIVCSEEDEVEEGFSNIFDEEDSSDLPTLFDLSNGK